VLYEAEQGEQSLLGILYMKKCPLDLLVTNSRLSGVGNGLILAMDMVHLGSESLGRLPAGRLAGRNLVHELISLFKGELK
jgi:hypothetical protein